MAALNRRSFEKGLKRRMHEVGRLPRASDRKEKDLEPKERLVGIEESHLFYIFVIL
jgi:hypothetical protein